MDIIDRTIEREGGFVMHPNDPGGATKYGITIGTLSDWLGRKASVEEVRNLEYADAYSIYHARYMREPGFDQIDDAWVREILFDAGVLWGPARAARWLQAAVGVKVDSRVGPITLNAANSTDGRMLGIRIIVEWSRQHAKRVQAGRSSPAFISGWINRATQHLLDMPEMALAQGSGEQL